LALSELMDCINLRRPCDSFVHTPMWGLQVLQVTKDEPLWENSYNPGTSQK